MRKVTESVRFIAAALALAGVLCASGAHAQRKNIHGRVAIGQMSINDSSDAGSFDSTRIYYRLIADEVGGYEDVSFNIDGRARSSSSDYNEDVPSNRLLLLNFKIRKIFNRIDLTLGRSFIEDILGHNIDGADVKIRVAGRTGFGLFGGLKPDPYDDSFNSDYMTYGGYAFSRSDEFGLSGGYALDTFKGNKDRERAHANLYFVPSKEFHVWSSADVDNIDDASGKGWEITNLLIHGNWRPGADFGVGFTYTDFRAVNRQAAMLEKNYEYTGDRYSVARISADMRLLGKNTIYGGFDQRSREIDSKSATRYYLGLRNQDFYFNTRWDLRYSDLSYFTSTIKAMYASLGLTLMDRLSADFSVTMLTNSQDGLGNDMEQMIYEILVDWQLTREIYAAVSYSFSQEKYLDVESIYSSRYDDNFTTTALYAQVGYRF